MQQPPKDTGTVAWVDLSTPEPEAAARRTREWAAKGFTGFKWYLPTNEEDGEEDEKPVHGETGALLHSRECIGSR